MKLIDKLFLVKRITSKSEILHFERYRLLNLYLFSINLHYIYQADTDRDLHDHPWDFITIPLKGSYIEKTLTCINAVKFGQIRYRKANFLHTIQEVMQPTVTLAILFRRRRIWGFQTTNGWIDFKTYRQLKHEKK